MAGDPNRNGVCSSGPSCPGCQCDNIPGTQSSNGLCIPTVSALLGRWVGQENICPSHLKLIHDVTNNIYVQ